VVGCFAAVGYEGGNAETVAGALAYFGLAGEVAAEGTPERMPEGACGPGTFEPHLLDALANLAADPARIGGGIRARELTPDR
jgi:hydroxyethylthiazole kinase